MTPPSSETGLTLKVFSETRRMFHVFAPLPKTTCPCPRKVFCWLTLRSSAASWPWNAVDYSLRFYCPHSNSCGNHGNYIAGLLSWDSTVINLCHCLIRGHNNCSKKVPWKKHFSSWLSKITSAITFLKNSSLLPPNTWFPLFWGHWTQFSECPLRNSRQSLLWELPKRKGEILK